MNITISGNFPSLKNLESLILKISIAQYFCKDKKKLLLHFKTKNTNNGTKYQ
jgi:hypothetical protein